MTKIEAIVQPNRFEAVKQALIDVGVEGMTISEVRGHGRQKGHKESYRGGEYSVDLVPKVKFEVVLQDTIVDTAVDAILKSAATGKIGDGKIFLYKVDEAIRSRSQERGAAAVSVFVVSVGQNVTTTNGGMCHSTSRRMCFWPFQFPWTYQIRVTWRWVVGYRRYGANA